MISPRTFILVWLGAILVFGPIGQFFFFRIEAVGALVLKTQTYDDAYWLTAQPKVLIMGSSHAKHVIVPNIISEENNWLKLDEVWNVGEESASPFEMYTTFEKNSEKFKNIEIVYYTLEPHILTEKYYLHNDYEKIFLTWRQWDYLAKEHHAVNSYYFPLHILLSAMRLTNPARSTKFNGFIPLKSVKYNVIKPGQVNKTYFAPLDLFPVSQFQLRYLKKLKDEIEMRGAKFIFVLTPTYSWSKYYQLESSEFDSLLVKDLTDVVGKCVVIGSMKKDMYGLTEGDFRDDTHLAKSGADKYTRQLFSDIRKHLTLLPKEIRPLYSY